jgi:CRP-like cAMP-binding protein
VSSQSDQEHDLGSIRLFADLNDEKRRAIARHCGWRRYTAGHQIIHHLDDSRDVFFIVEGVVHAVSYSLSGKRVSYRDIGAGETFGEFAALDGKPRSASVVAHTDCLIASLDEKAFWQVLRDHPDVTAALLRHLTGLVRLYSERVQELATLPVSVRIQLELLRLAGPAEEDDNAAVIEPAPTHAELADRLGTHREAVTRALSALRRDGILSETTGRFVISSIRLLQDSISKAIGG